MRSFEHFGWVTPIYIFLVSLFHFRLDSYSLFRLTVYYDLGQLCVCVCGMGDIFFSCMQHLTASFFSWSVSCLNVCLRCLLSFRILFASSNIEPTFSLSGILDVGLGVLGSRFPTRSIRWEANTIFTPYAVIFAYI